MVKSWGRSLRSAVVVGAVAVGLVAAIATPAQAAGIWSFGEGFENNPAATWWFENPGNGHGDFGGFDGAPRTGAGYATIYRFTQGWNSVDRSLHLPAVSGFLSTRRCTLQGYIQETVGTRFNLEVIDPAHWTYIALGTFTTADTLTWNPYSVSWSGGPDDVVLRFVVVSDAYFARVKIDDVSVVCITFP